ncbi:uncharacterized protein ACLA_097330 [Aspergillus clavatus NRRL 1]|uniref:Macro domain-like protein n=1 Tax=Aspergillus clavatus (strain ATCC 1007 / CBS 513.65 / DSM 816 / NCTC 3887 / NRRL 1 / QM 1276 / 107) TaxID=344612 RepID=A1CMK8_ASPCL|nr:uncharacterized protein ACLA_097330 [Aspergillus clavatus NRRL 1]EAW08795.1 conserved hypothetical protein [Aspergillus clavatus NRRL 1]
MTSNIPHIHLLCMEDRFISAFHRARAQYWPRSHHPNLTIHNTSLAQLPAATKFNLIVSPANSYGRLDGAFDDAISRAFAPKADYHALTRAAQRVLYEKWRGFAPPGTCSLVPFPPELQDNAWGCRWVAICPTMRVPERVVWDREVVYECVWSLLCEVEGWNRRRQDRAKERIEAVLVTPLATGVGAVSPEKWAAQFVLAMKHFVDAVERPERWGALGWEEIHVETQEVRKTWEI